ncbi:MAG: TonB-dependent receptor [Gemmatimonadales bacterium]|nr:TonB-dependent receptor [Gemmatimonadales bacterium]
MLAFCCLLLGLSASVGLSYQEPADTVRKKPAALEELVVRAVKPIVTVGGASAFELRLDSLRVPPAPSLELVVRELPALRVRRNSRGEAELSARGSDSRQVAVLVDGIPLNLAWDARVDLSVVPATAVDRLEYTRGLATMLQGPNALGGVLDIRVGSSMLQPSGKSAQLAFGADALGGVSTSGTLSLPFETGAGRWLVRTGAGFADSPGYPLARGIVEPIPGTRDTRVNTDSRSYDGFAAVRFQGHSGTWGSVTGFGFRGSRGIAAELGNSNARFWRYPHLSRAVAVASGGTGDRAALFGGRGDLEASLGVDVGRTEIDSYTGRDYTAVNGFEDGHDRTLTLRLLGDHTLGSRGELRSAFTLAETRHDERLPGESARYRQRVASLGAETVWRLIEGRGAIESLRLSIGGAYDNARTPETGGRPSFPRYSEWGGRLGATLGLDGGTRIHGGVSRRARFPALRELYSGALDRFAPNPELRPENLVGMETGVTAPIGRGEVQVVAFRHQVNDAVVRVTLPAPDRRFMRVNRDRIRSTGVELLGTVPIGAVTLSADLTLQSIGISDTAAVPRQPEGLPEVYGSVRTRFPLPVGLFGGVDLGFTGRQFCIDPGTGADTRLDGGALFGAELSRRWSVRRGGMLSRLEARVSLENLGDRAVFDQCGLPLPGRSLRLLLRVF